MEKKMKTIEIIEIIWSKLGGACSICQQPY